MKYYSNDIYPIALVLSYDAESVNKEYFNAYDGEEYPITVKSTSEATTMPLTRRTKDYYAMATGIIFNKKPTPKLIAHEAFHAVKMMLDEGLHCPLDDSSEEAWAYLIGWIVDCIDKFIKGTLNESNRSYMD